MAVASRDRGCAAAGREPAAGDRKPGISDYATAVYPDSVVGAGVISMGRSSGLPLQRIGITGDLRDSFGIFCAVDDLELTGRGRCLRLCRSPSSSRSPPNELISAAQQVYFPAYATNSAARGSRRTPPVPPSKPQRPVADGQYRRPHTAAAAITQQIRPRFVRFAVPVSECDEFLAAIGAYADHRRQAQFLLLQADFQVDAVHPQMHIIHTRKPPGSKGFRFVLPLAGQLVDRRHGQARPGAEELLERPGRSRRWTARADTTAEAPR